jgi:glutamine amidotransferase
MARIVAAGLDRLLPTLRQPLLGICLGMQLLFDASDEGDVRCLGLLPGRVGRLAATPGQPVPHMGWNTVQRLRDDPLLEGIAADERVYFVHSYAARVNGDTVAGCDYSGGFAAVVGRANFRGVQFHPERSGPVGARLLANFLRL